MNSTPQPALNPDLVFNHLAESLEEGRNSSVDASLTHWPSDASITASQYMRLDAALSRFVEAIQTPSEDTDKNTVTANNVRAFLDEQREEPSLARQVFDAYVEETVAALRQNPYDTTRIQNAAIKLREVELEPTKTQRTAIHLAIEEFTMRHLAVKAAVDSLRVPLGFKVAVGAPSSD
jgi:hypothetical protein